MSSHIRVVECGGQGARVVDVSDDNQVFPRHQSTGWEGGIEWLTEFSQRDLMPSTMAIIYSVAGVVESHKKLVICANVRQLDGAVLGETTSGVPIWACHDMEASTTGIASLYPELEYFMALTRSSGIGGGVWKNGFLAPLEVGHIKIDNSPFAPVCGCGKRGCAEAFIGGNALERFVAGEMLFQKRQIPNGVRPCAWLDVCYNNDEQWAIRHYNEVIIPATAQLLCTLQSALHFPVLVWKGNLGLCAFRDIPGLEKAIRAETKRLIIDPSWIDALEFKFLGCPRDHDAYIGAAVIARRLM